MAPDPRPEPRPLALVTGAAGGIGRGVCAMLSARGYRIIAVDLSADLLASVVAEIGADTIAVPSDARDAAQVDELARRIREEWADALEILVCNAGIIAPSPVAEADPAMMRTQLDVMLATPVQLIRAAIPAMVAGGRGHVLCTVSMGGILALPGSATYSAAKAGLRAFLTALSAEVKPHGVAVSGIYPSAVDTPMLRYEARHGGSMLNFVGTVFSVSDVVRGYEKALRTRRLEVYLPWSDSVTSRGFALVPAFMNRVIPTFERMGKRGHAAYVARVEAEEHAANL